MAKKKNHSISKKKIKDMGKLIPRLPHKKLNNAAFQSRLYLSRIVDLEYNLVTLRNEMLADMHRINGLEKHTTELATSNRDLAQEVLRLDAFCRTVKTSVLDVPIEPNIVTVSLTENEWSMILKGIYILDSLCKGDTTNGTKA